jgi:hypothetical protein
LYFLYPWLYPVALSGNFLSLLYIIKINFLKVPNVPHSKTNSRAIFYWLLICAFMVMAMTGIGAVTRLTESGLSITEWNVVSVLFPR